MLVDVCLLSVSSHGREKEGREKDRREKKERDSRELAHLIRALIPS